MGEMVQQQQSTVADIFRRAQALRQDHSDWSYKQVQDALVREFSGGAFPPLYNLTIPEQDARAPEEDWTAGLPIVRRGIQYEDWNEVAAGIIICLEQTENYERARGPEGSRDDWHDRNVGIDEAVAKGVGKWMPEELLALAERKGKK
ncbi:MAG TPA: hypothetical protein VFY67_08025 [Pyrinomonadaceae bacterium]|nr:hypothetical protein [Pyrinomonadaceae bacterium]